MKETKREVRAGEAGRSSKIRRLEELVRESRIRNAGFSPTWSVDGSLITYSADWQGVSMCESSGRWHIDSQYDGGLQFHPQTWIGFGGGEFARFAYQATKMQQIAVAERVLAIQGPRAWPNCFTHLPVDFDL
jgi:Transglycosylase-like domain